MSTELRSRMAELQRSPRHVSASRNSVRLCCLTAALAMTTLGCKPPARNPDHGKAIANAATPSAKVQEAELGTTKPRIRSRPMPPMPGPPNLQLLGTWQTLEGTAVDIVLVGTYANHVAGVELAGDQCAYQTQKSTHTMRMFRCVGPLNAAGVEESFAYAKVSYNTGAPATNTGPFYFRSQASWRYYAGEYYMQSAWSYVVNASPTQGPTINLEPRTLPGYTGDPTVADQAAGFNAVKLWGPGGPIICNTVGYFEYRCPVLAEGIYVFDILFEQGSRYIPSNSFVIKVVYGALDTPAPDVGNNPGSSNPPVTAPQCDPLITKGC